MQKGSCCHFVITNIYSIDVIGIGIGKEFMLGWLAGSLEISVSVYVCVFVRGVIMS